MCKHEEKSCPRCGQQFECKIGDIAHCQCFDISFTIEEKAFIEERYEECLCRNCLLELKKREIRNRELKTRNGKI
jgi:hypothetical protein